MRIRYLFLAAMLLVSSSFARGQTGPNIVMCRGDSYTLSDPANLLSASTARLAKRMAEIVGGCLSDEAASTKTEQQSVEAEKKNFLVSKEMKDFDVEVQPLAQAMSAHMALHPTLKQRDNELKIESDRIDAAAPALTDKQGVESYNGKVAGYNKKVTKLEKDWKEWNTKGEEIIEAVTKLPTYIVALAKEAEIRERLKKVIERRIKLQQDFERSFSNWKQIDAIQATKYKVNETGTVPSFFGTQDVDTRKVNLTEDIEKLKGLADGKSVIDFDQRKKP